MDIKVLGAACKSMLTDVERLVARLRLDARVEYVTDVGYTAALLCKRAAV